MKSYDVVICGGGLAGLTLGRYLRRELPEASVAIVEPTRRPLPPACHKVGESSVEIGAQFFEARCGLSEYLHSRHLVKNGLRYFSGDTRGPLARRREIGPSEQPTINSWQLDRGRLEDDLRQMVVDDGVVLLEGFSVYRLDLGEGGAPHLVHVAAPGTKDTLEARWVVDASGRRRLLHRKLGLTRASGHDHSSAWFRIRGHLEVGELVPETERAWHARDVDRNRWLSTCHLMGKGYWVWLIPLGGGHHSIGVVASDEHHPFETYARPDRMMAWLAEHEPVLHERLAGRPMEDFKILKDYAYSSAKVFSADRWACIGEAAVFVDPLYSPGSDFIALTSSMTTELVRADLAGADRASLEARTEELERFFLAFTELTFETFRGHSHINGAPAALASKLYWDSTHYWSFVCPYFFNDIFRLAPAEHARFRLLHREFAQLNRRAQALLKSWADMAPGLDRAWGDFVPLPQFPSALADLHIDLATRRSPDETYAVMQRNLENARIVVSEIVLRALSAVGPGGAAQLAQRTGFLAWDDLAAGASRLDWDEASDRGAARKTLTRIARDMDRALGKPDAVAPAGPRVTLRELLAAAREGARSQRERPLVG